MKRVTKEWVWILCATVASLLCVAVLIGTGIRPDQSLPLAVYVIVFPVALVYFIRLLVGMVKGLRKKLRR